MNLQALVELHAVSCRIVFESHHARGRGCDRGTHLLPPFGTGIRKAEGFCCVPVYCGLGL